MPSRRRLQQYAVGISILSVFYNTAEGVVSIVFGAESSSRSLVFYGIQSGIEVISALMVTWRFINVVRPGDEDSEDLSITSPKIIRVERIATTCIGILLIALSLAAFATSAASLAAHESPTTTIPSLIIAGSATGIMLVLWLIKRYLARALNSSAMNGEALCSLECTQLSVVLLIGSLIYRVWHGGWWVDSATAIVIGLLFGWEGVKMIKWARSESFDGGCCESCHPRELKGDEAGLRSDTPDEKREGSPSCCSASSSCCGGSEKLSDKEGCCSRGLKGDGAATRCDAKQEALRGPCAASGGCCGSSKKDPTKEQSRSCSKKEVPQTPCGTSGGCCGSAKKEAVKEACCSGKSKGNEVSSDCNEKKETSQTPYGASSKCCGGLQKEPVKQNCCSGKKNGGDEALTPAIPSCEKKETLRSPCGASSVCCGSSKKESAKQDCCSRKQTGDEEAGITVVLLDEKKEALQSPCGASSGCCGGSKKERV